MVCPAGKVLDSVTLVGGINSGYFRDHGKVKDMQKCRRICCEMPHCHLAFMLSSNCFSVACKSADACKTQSANPSRYSPKISYVRNYDTNELLGTNYFYLIFFLIYKLWTSHRYQFLFRKRTMTSLVINLFVMVDVISAQYEASIRSKLCFGY